MMKRWRIWFYVQAVATYFWERRSYTGHRAIIDPGSFYRQAIVVSKLTQSSKKTTGYRLAVLNYSYLFSYGKQSLEVSPFLRKGLFFIPDLRSRVYDHGLHGLHGLLQINAN